MINDQSPPSTATQADELEAIYTRNYNFIVEQALSDGRLFISDAHGIAQGVARHLQEYTGELTDEDFQTWAKDNIGPAVFRLSTWYSLKAECTQLVHAAIWRALGHAADPSKYDDYPELVKELANEVWLWVFLNLDSLLIRGKAKLSTRLYALAKRHTALWKKKQANRRYAVIRHVYSLPRQKDAAIKADAMDLASAEAAALEQEEAAIRAEMAEEGLLPVEKTCRPDALSPS